MSLELRLQNTLRLHLDPIKGSVYWIERQKKLGFSFLEEIRSLEDLSKIGAMPLDVLSERPVEDFIPRLFLEKGRKLIFVETGGATGTPKTTAYFEDEFEAIFVKSFFQVADASGFPRSERWLWIGPGGPHVIGKAAMAIARSSGSGDAFSVDFDPRWYRRLAPESMARQRYLEHLTDQAVRVMRQQNIGCLFSTPVVLSALAQKLDAEHCRRVRGVYFGGMTLTAEVMEKLKAAFPNAVFISGYGNTLFGVCHAAGDLRACGGNIRYFSQSDRIAIKLVRADGSAVSYGERGQVLFHRFDESFFLPNVLERDSAVRVRANELEAQMGFLGDGLLNPEPLVSRTFKVDAGVY